MSKVSLTELRSNYNNINCLTLSTYGLLHSHGCLTVRVTGSQKGAEAGSGARVDSARILRLAKLSLCLVLSFNIWCGVAGTVIETAPSPASRKHECIIFWGDPLTHSLTLISIILVVHSITHSLTDSISFSHTRHSLTLPSNLSPFLITGSRSLTHTDVLLSITLINHTCSLTHSFAL